LGSLTYRQSLSCRRNLNGVQPVGCATDNGRTKGTKAEEQESSNRTTSEHVSLLALPTSGWRPIMSSPQSPPDQKGQAKRNLPNSSAQINPCGRRFGVYAVANGQPFLVLACLFLKSFSYRPSRDGWCHRMYTGSGWEILGVHSHTGCQTSGPVKRRKSGLSWSDRII
jgi:hypothetical protein